jgi:hypothetical protein
MTPRAGALIQAAHQLALGAAAVEAMRELADRGVASLLLKGPAVARRLYPDDPTRRTYCDVDLLVSPPTFAAAEGVLADLGYRPTIEGARPGDSWWHAHSWFRPGPVRIEIDLHRSFTGVRNHQRFWDVLWSTRDQLVLGGTPVAVPSAPGAALLLALHAASPGGSSKPGTELQMALDAFGDDLWVEAAEVAREIGSEPAFAVGLCLSPPGQALAARLHLSSAGTPVEWLRAHSASRSASALADLAAHPSLVARARHVWRRLRPSAAFLRHTSPLARRGRLGLTLAYAGRLGSLLVGAPAGAYELWVATRTMRGTSRGPAHRSPPPSPRPRDRPRLGVARRGRRRCPNGRLR